MILNIIRDKKIVPMVTFLKPFFQLAVTGNYFVFRVRGSCVGV